MNRFDLQRLSNARLRESRLLLAAGKFSGAYYLAGYAIECGLKACFARGMKRYNFPDKNVRKIFVHNLTELVVLANLKNELLMARQANSRFGSGWDIACRWTEESRYAANVSKSDAEELLNAIAARKDGVLPWIKRYW